MNDLIIDFEKIINTNEIMISIVGIFIVFSALAFISLFIAVLPKFLPLLGKFFPEEHPHHSHGALSGHTADHEEVLAAIAYALFRKTVGSLPGK
jgi:Na+-transporting methylmalonyl-CoA/oxaloacetate decarboxylase gamma subunit